MRSVGRKLRYTTWRDLKTLLRMTEEPTHGLFSYVGVPHSSVFPRKLPVHFHRLPWSAVAASRKPTESFFREGSWMLHRGYWRIPWRVMDVHGYPPNPWKVSWIVSGTHVVKLFRGNSSPQHCVDVLSDCSECSRTYPSPTVERSRETSLEIHRAFHVLS